MPKDANKTGVGRGGASRMALTFLVAVVFTATASVIGLPVTAVVPIVFVFVFAAIIAMRLSELIHVPEGDVVCPRCEGRPRGVTGWCAPCLAVLETSPLDPGHPAYRLLQAIERGDAAAMAPFVGSKVTVRGPNGKVSTLSGKAWVRGTKLSMALYRNRTGTLLAVFLDPANAELVWARTHDVATGLLLIPDMDVVMTSSYRVPHDRVTEMNAYPALPPSSRLA